MKVKERPVRSRGSEVTVEVLETFENLSTSMAWCVRVEEDGFEGEAERIFLPKSQVERDGNSYVMPQWLAEEKDLEEYVTS